MINIFSETKKYRGDEIMIATGVDGDKEIMDVLSSGDPLTDDTIELLTSRYSCGRREYQARGGDVSQITDRSHHGSIYAGFCMAKHNGVVTIENFNQPPYTVKNSVVFSPPVSPSTS